MAPSQVDGFLNWKNWRNRVWNPAVLAAGFFREVTSEEARQGPDRRFV